MDVTVGCIISLTICYLYIQCVVVPAAGLEPASFRGRFCGYGLGNRTLARLTCTEEVCCVYHFTKRAFILKSSVGIILYCSLVPEDGIEPPI